MHFWWHFFLLKPKANASNLGAALAGLLPSAQGLPWCGIHKGKGVCVSPLLNMRAPWAGVPFLCHAQLMCAHRTVLAGPKGCSGTLLLFVSWCDWTWHHWQVQELSSDPDIALRAGLFLCNSILTTKQPLLQVPHSFCKHLQAFSSPDGGQSCGGGLWAGANCKSISLTSSLLKKLDIRALTTANLLLSPPPEKWIILMLTEGFSFFKSRQI